MRRLHKILMMLTAIVSLTPALARAQGVAHDQSSTATFSGAASAHRGFGVGALALFAPRTPGNISNTVPNLLATWGDSAGRFHIDGLFGMYHQDNTSLDFGVSGWYHIHATSSADLSLGAGLALLTYRDGTPASRKWDFEITLGSQIRAFIVPNVALLGSLGMGIYLPDSGPSVINISGNLVGTVGVAYYFQ